MDALHLSSVSRPLLRGQERASKCVSKPPPAKRRKLCSAMDASTYHARVVRVAEPTVVASDLSAFQSSYLEALLDAGYLPPSGSSPSASPFESNNVSISKLDERPPTSAASGPNEPSASALPTTENPPSISAIPHPRPESSDLWEEEDSRRIRFALTDETDDHVERLRNAYVSILPSQLGDDSQRPVSNDAHVSTDPRPSRESPDAVWLPTPAATLPFSQLFGWALPPPPPLPLDTASQPAPDDSLLPVDHHRRNYDVADFVEQWQAEARDSHLVPNIELTIGPSPWRRPLHDYIRSGDPFAYSADPQGISWESFGTTRESALDARWLYQPRATSDHKPRLVASTREQTALHYQPRAFAPGHRARFAHYQLRHLAAVGSGRNVYYAAGSKVEKVPLACPSANRTIVDLSKPTRSASPFKITCLANTSSSSPNQDNELLLAGGFNGEYALLDLNSPASTKPLEGTVSHARDGIVNHIATFRARRSGIPHAAFASNDHSLRIMDLSRQRFTHTFTYGSAINCSTMSPDARLRALVHDGSDTLITNAEDGEVLVRLEAHADYAFACDWSACGRYLATGAEDGVVAVWDARNWARPLERLECVMSCARSLRFAEDGMLVVAESEDVVSVVDTADFGSRQDLRFFGSIAGVGLVGGGEEIVVANADETVGGLLSYERASRGRGRGGGFGRVWQPAEGRSRRWGCDGAVVDVFV